MAKKITNADKSPRDVASFRAVDASTALLVRPDDSVLLNLMVRSTIQDRYAGTSVAEPVWREEASLNVIMNRCSQAGVREECAAFFLKRRTKGVLKSLTETRSITVGDVIFQPDSLFAAITKSVSVPGSAAVIMEVINSFLRRKGMMSNNGEITTEMSYPLKTVVVDSLSNDVAMQEVVRVLNDTPTSRVGNGRYTSETFAAEVAEALVPVGRALLDINEMGVVMDDILRGVLANITQGFDNGLTGAVPASWRDHPVIVELASNYTFIRAALALPRGSSITPVSEGWKLHQWAPIVLAALKSSRRYAIVGKTEVMRNITKRSLRDLQGNVRSFVMHRSAVPAAVAQCVYAFEDAALASAVTVIPMKERIDLAIAGAYGKAANLGTDFAAGRLYDFLNDAIEGGYDASSMGYILDVGAYGEASVHELVCLCSKEVLIDVGVTGEIVDDASPISIVDDKAWWFTMATNERMLSRAVSGRFNGPEFITHNVHEALLAMGDFSAAGPMDARPQLISPIAFNTRMIGFDASEVLVEVGERFTYDVHVGSTRLTGSFRAHELGSMRSSVGTSIVRPRFNQQVFNAAFSVFETIEHELKKMRGQASDPAKSSMAMSLVEHLSRRRGVILLEMAQNISPAFRSEVHHGIARRSVTGLTAEEALAVTSRLSQRQFGAYADVAALLLFLSIQGIDIKFSEGLLGDELVIACFMERGSDREAIQF